MERKAIPNYLPADINLPNGRTLHLQEEYDSDHGAPWEESDGHGPVSDWRSIESKAPGERVLCRGRGSARFYDYAEAIRIAKRDGWGAPDGEHATAGARAAAAVDADFEFLRSWCADEWHYIGIIATLRDADGKELAQASCWGIESCGDYWRDVAAELAEECLAEQAAAEHVTAVRKCFI